MIRKELESFIQLFFYIRVIMKRVSFYTFGCKLNQTETSFLENEFSKQGYKTVAFNEPADYVVINTCTVTGRTDYKCRQVIRKAKRISPQATIAVVGCYAQMAPEKLKILLGVKLVLGADKKFEIFNYLNDSESSNGVIEAHGENDKFIDSTPDLFAGHTRAFLKIQDGCNSYCSYCIVPFARGRSRSDQPENVLKNAKKLVANGYQEIVLTGVHIGKYGHDLKPRKSLFELLKEIVKIPGIGRIRLSSLEPTEIDDDIISLIAGSEKICPHFHVPIQSGDNEILKNMRRHYSVTDYAELVEKIRKKIPHVGLGSDVIVGFPGETDYHFENTKNLIHELPFTYLHVFSFSERQGTDASKMPGKVDSKQKKERSARLIEIGKQKKAAFYQQAIGNTYHVLFEDEEPGEWMCGFTENYIRVKAVKESGYFNTIKRTCIVAADNDFASGKF